MSRSIKATVLSFSMAGALLGGVVPAAALSECAPTMTTETINSTSYQVAVFPTGTCSWTVPEGVTEIDLLIVAGGGGGGAGSPYALTPITSAGGGGGGGSVTEALAVAVTPGVAALVEVGAGGARGTGGTVGTSQPYGSDGADGGNSSFAIAGSSPIVTVGGGAGRGSDLDPQSGYGGSSDTRPGSPLVGTAAGGGASATGSRGFASLAPFPGLTSDFTGTSVVYSYGGGGASATEWPIDYPNGVQTPGSGGPGGRGGISTLNYGYTPTADGADGTVVIRWVGSASSNSVASEPAVAAPYTGPILNPIGGSFAAGDVVNVTGSRLESVSSIEIGGVVVQVTGATETGFSFVLPAGLTAGVVDINVSSDFGRLLYQDAFTVAATPTSSAAESRGYWTKLQSDGKTVKVYAKDIVGSGKVQFMLGGREIAWVNAADASDPKFSFANGFSYLVRTVNLVPGKNRFEILVDGERVFRATYVPKG